MSRRPIRAATGFVALALIAALFQAALVLGAPWGRWTMGGQFPGALPAPARGLALAQGVVLLAMAHAVWRAATWVDPPPRGRLWLVIGLTLASLAANLATPSAPERLLWAPVTAAMAVLDTLVLHATRTK